MPAWDATRAQRAAFLCCMLLSAAALPRSALASAARFTHRATRRQMEEPSQTASLPLPKVALLFLTSEGRIHNEEVWANFLRLASGIAPADLPPVPGPPSKYVDLKALTGGELFPELGRAPHHQFSMNPAVGTHHHLERQPYSFFEPWAWERDLVQLVSNGTCSAAGVADGCPGRSTSDEDSNVESPTSTPSSVIAQQNFFSVYTHPPPGYDFPAHSLFAGTEVSPRANTTRAYCEHRLVKGMLRLMEAALEDPWNEKFVMVSETSVPLYPPHVMWAQLMVEQLSRVNACPLRREDTWNLRRWHKDMETPFLKKEHFGKSQQWVVLSRELAALAVADRHVEVQFEAHCFTAQGEEEQWRECISDEHFFPTLFAAYGVTHKTDCRGNAHYVDWNSSPEGGTHPTSFLPTMIVRELVPAMRNIIWHQCDPQATLASAEALFHRVGRPAPQPAPVADASLAYASAISGGNGSAPRAAVKEWALRRGFVPLAFPCQLFARKFPAVSEIGTAQMAVSCAGLGFGPWCMHNRRLWMEGSEPAASQGRFTTYT